jgi:diguanylate cyclase
MSSLHPLTLGFPAPETEQAFARHSFSRVLEQGRMALAVAALVYFAFGLLDHRFLNANQLATIRPIRLLAVWIPVLVLLFTFHPLFRRFHQPLLALVGLSEGIGLIARLCYLPVETSSYYFPELILVAALLYNLFGIRFIHALALNVLLLVLYNVACGYSHGYPTAILLNQNFFFVAANLIGGAAAYLGEHRSRELFVRQKELEAERRLHLKRSLHDRLTGLPNRELLTDRINRTLAKAKRDGSLHAGMFIDLDGFKAINDLLGHDRGDIALRRIARRLLRAVREADTVARIGGDEFFVLVQGIGSPENAGQLANKLLSYIETPISGLPANTKLSASIGVCLFPGSGEDDDDADKIIRLADHAMYRAKGAGKGRFAFANQTGLPPEARRAG